MPGGDGGECGERGEGDKDFQRTVATVASDACCASRAQRTRGALRCDLATVLLRNQTIKNEIYFLKAGHANEEVGMILTALSQVLGTAVAIVVVDR